MYAQGFWIFIYVYAHVIHGNEQRTSTLRSSHAPHLMDRLSGVLFVRNGHWNDSWCLLMMMTGWLAGWQTDSSVGLGTETSILPLMCEERDSHRVGLPCWLGWFIFSAGIRTMPSEALKDLIVICSYRIWSRIRFFPLVPNCNQPRRGRGKKKRENMHCDGRLKYLNATLKQSPLFTLKTFKVPRKH